MLKKILLSAAILLILSLNLISQNNSVETVPVQASVRTGKITAKWIDRATLSGIASRPEGRNILWYRQPAKVWEEA